MRECAFEDHPMRVCAFHRSLSEHWCEIVLLSVGPDSSSTFLGLSNSGGSASRCRPPFLRSRGMAAHDYSLSVDECPRCVELKNLEHDMDVPPSGCRACNEWRLERSGKSRTHVPGLTFGLVVPRVAHATGASMSLPIPSPKPAVVDSGRTAAADQAARQAVERLRAKEAAERAVADSWDLVIKEINRQMSPSGGHALKT
jgi:hypothetical protein